MNRNNASIELPIIYTIIFMIVLSIGARYGDHHFFIALDSDNRKIL